MDQFTQKTFLKTYFDSSIRGYFDINLEKLMDDNYISNFMEDNGIKTHQFWSRLEQFLSNLDKEDRPQEVELYERLYYCLLSTIDRQEIINNNKLYDIFHQLTKHIIDHYLKYELRLKKNSKIVVVYADL